MLFPFTLNVNYVIPFSICLTTYWRHWSCPQIVLVAPAFLSLGVVIPLLSGYPALRHLNPELQHDGRRLIVATRLIAAVRRSRLHRSGSVADQGDLITLVVDVVMAGVWLARSTRVADIAAPLIQTIQEVRHISARFGLSPRQLETFQLITPPLQHPLPLLEIKRGIVCRSH